MIDIYRFGTHIATRVNKLEVCKWIRENLYPGEEFATDKGDWDLKRKIAEDDIINYAKTKGYSFKSNF